MPNNDTTSKPKPGTSSFYKKEGSFISTNSQMFNLSENLDFFFGKIINLSIQCYSHTGRIKSWDVNSEALFGASSEEAIGSNLLELGFLTPEAHDKFRELINEVSFTGASCPPNHWSIVDRNGRSRQIISIIYNCSDPDENAQVYCIDFEITDKVADGASIEKAIGAISESLQSRFSIVLNLDLNTNRLRCWDLPEPLTYLADLINEQTPQSLMHDFVYEHDRETVEAAMDQLYYSNKSRIDIVFGVCIRGVKIDAVSAHILKAPAIDDKKSCLIVVREETNQLREHLKRKADRDESQQTRLNKDSYLARIAHDIRTPLASVKGFLELAREQLEEVIDKDKQLSTYFDAIERNADHCLKLTSEALDFNRIAAGQIDLNIRSFHLLEFVVETIESLELRAHAAGLNIILEKDLFNKDLNLISDSTKLRDILYNLITNAIKFAAKGDIILSIKARKDADLIDFSVTNEGVGISPTECESIFEPFRKQKISPNTETEGWGLGLYTCRKFVTALGGIITCESEINGKTRFTFNIKRKLKLQSNRASKN